jgi:C4-dicarboxylate transporter DctM subunit
MARGSIAGRLTRFMVAITSSIPGGLAVATILALTVFGAVSGTSAVTMMAIGSIMYPALLANGYTKSFALGLLAAGGTLGVIIPPSLLMIVYGVMTEVSITDLFKAGWGPGLLLSGLLTIYSMALHWRMATKPFDLMEVWASFKDGVLALLMPVILLGGIYSGWYTVTESAAIAVVYAVAVEALFYRELTLAQSGEIVVENLKMLGALMPLLAIAVSLNNILELDGVPQALVKWMQTYVSSQSRCSSSPIFCCSLPAPSWTRRRPSSFSARCWHPWARPTAFTMCTGARS